MEQRAGHQALVNLMCHFIQSLNKSTQTAGTGSVSELASMRVIRARSRRKNSSLARGTPAFSRPLPQSGGTSSSKNLSELQQSHSNGAMNGWTNKTWHIMGRRHVCPTRCS